MSTSPRRRDQGFTLVEMLIVIVVLGVLATIVVFAVRGIRTLAEDNSEAADAKTLETAAEGHMALHGVYADEAALVTAGLLREPSQMFDINVLDAGEDYELVPEGTGSGGGGGSETTVPTTVPGPGPGEPGGPPLGAQPASYAGQTGWSFGADSSPKRLVIIGNGSGSAGQVLWNSIVAAGVALSADTQVIWMDQVSTAAEVESILDSNPTYIIVPVAVPISGGGAGQPYAGQYIRSTGLQSPTDFWWGQNEGGVGGAVAYYLNNK